MSALLPGGIHLFISKKTSRPHTSNTPDLRSGCLSPRAEWVRSPPEAEMGARRSSTIDRWCGGVLNVGSDGDGLPRLESIGHFRLERPSKYSSKYSCCCDGVLNVDERTPSDPYNFCIWVTVKVFWNNQQVHDERDYFDWFPRQSEYCIIWPLEWTADASLYWPLVSVLFVDSESSNCWQWTVIIGYHDCAAWSRHSTVRCKTTCYCLFNISMDFHSNT